MVDNLYIRKDKINYKLNLHLLVAGRFISLLGTSIFGIALSLYVLDITESASAFSLVLSSSILPGALLNMFIGVFIDKNDKRKIIIISDMISGFAVLLFGLAFMINSTNILLFVLYSSSLSIIQSFYNLAINASIPNIVSDEKISDINSLFQSMRAIVNIIGPIIGALIYKIIGMNWVFLINGLSFIISGIAEIYIKFKTDYRARNEVHENYFKSIMEINKYLDEQKPLKFMLIFAIVINFFYNPLIIEVLPYIAHNVIKVTGIQLSVIQSSAAIGIILGSIMLSRKWSNRNLICKFFWLLFFQAVLINLWALPDLVLIKDSSNLYITIFFSVLLILYGVLQSLQNIPIITHFQLLVPENLRGRVFGIFFTALQITTPLGLWLYGYALERIQWGYVIICSGIIMIMLSIYGGRNHLFSEMVIELKEIN